MARQKNKIGLLSGPHNGLFLGVHGAQLIKQAALIRNNLLCCFGYNYMLENKQIENIHDTAVTGLAKCRTLTLLTIRGPWAQVLGSQDPGLQQNTKQDVVGGPP